MTKKPQKNLTVLPVRDHDDHDHAHAPGVHKAANRQVAGQQFAGRAAVVTLGCAKNQVDSEVMIGVLAREGYEITAELESADVAVINTCGFLQSAVEESINCIMDVAQYKEQGTLRKLIVAGCAVERYREELKKNLPEVDAFVTLEDIMRIGDAAKAGDSAEFDQLLGRAGRPYFLYDEKSPRILGIAKHHAYVKVSEGCNRPCAFCIIPAIRGAMRSRSIDSIVKEVQDLSSAGVQEVNLVAQDLTSYGTDRKGSQETLALLLQRLQQETTIPWVRLLYAYPIGVTTDLLQAIVSLPRVVEYLDIPLQHSSEEVLRRMKRPIGKFAARPMTEFIRATAPEVAIRTTFIVGFPGETEQDVQDLVDFVAEGHFASVGVFTYSPEQGTPAAELDQQVPEREKKKRRERVMEAQREVVARRLAGMVGSKIEVLVDGAHEEVEFLTVGRARWQAPEVDGVVIINDSVFDEPLTPGTRVMVEISEVAGYDLVGKAVEMIHQPAKVLGTSPIVPTAVKPSAYVSQG